MTHEELQTLIIRIEGILNSRPLTPLSNDPQDLTPLTPSHFLIGRSSAIVPETLYNVENPPFLRRWKLINLLTQHFWKRWQIEYLHTLQPRGKWLNVTKNMTPGMLVLIHDPHSPPSQWKLGRITQVFPGQDCQVRVVELKTKTGNLTRPVVKIYPLPIE